MAAERAEAQLNAPRNVALDSAGNLYISEFSGHRIRLVTADGMIWTLAGIGTAGSHREEIAATLSELAYPAGLYLDFTGTLFIADSATSASGWCSTESCARCPGRRRTRFAHGCG